MKFGMEQSINHLEMLILMGIDLTSIHVIDVIYEK